MKTSVTLPVKAMWLVAIGIILCAVVYPVVLRQNEPVRPRNSSATTPEMVPTDAGAIPIPIPQAKGYSARTNFHWSQVESTDYLVYIQNLRAIGCPEETVRDIIVADVNKLFAPRYLSLVGSAPELAWWGRFDRKRPVRPELAAQLRSLNEEKKQLLQRLLGADLAADFPYPESSVAALREENTYAFLPEGKRAAVRDLVGRFRVLREWSEAQWKGLPGDEREARRRELDETRTRELAGLLTPEEQREFALRDSVASDILRSEFGQSNLSEPEFRKLFDLYDDFRRNHPEARREDIQRLEQSYAEALGPERLADLQRQSDRTWQALQGLAGEGVLSPEAMEQAYAIKQAYSKKLVEGVGQMFSSREVTPKPMREIVAEMDRELESVLGAEVVKRLDRLGALPRMVVQDDGKRVSYSFSRGGSAD